MATVHRSSRAESDLTEIWGYIAMCDALAADRQLDRVDSACKMLAESPLGGPSRDDLAPGLRFYPVDNYLIFYTTSANGIIVARVLHGARDYPQEFE